MGKRASQKSPVKRKVKKQRLYTEVPELTEVAFSALEDMAIDIQFRKEIIPNLKMADVYGFVRFASKLPELDIDLVNRFLENYNINDGSSLVNGRRIVLTEALLKKALYLPISEIGVGDARPPPNFKPGHCFKTGMDALDAKQGWKLGETSTPEMIEWLRFVQKRLVLGAHGTYLAQKYLYAATQTFNGMQFNWALFVVERIYQELELKRKKGKIGTLISASYISVAVKYQLSQPLTESDEELERDRALPGEATGMEAATEGAARQGRTRQQTQQGQKEKAVMPESSSPVVNRKRTDQRVIPSSPSEPPMERGSDSNPSAQVEVERVPDAQNQAGREPGMLKDYVLLGLEQMTEWVRKYQEPDIAKMASNLKVLRVGGRKLQADFDRVTNEMALLKAEMGELRKKNQALQEEKESYVEEMRLERERNEIAYATSLDARVALEANLKKSQAEHQRIKDDLDVQLNKALQENLVLQDSVRDRDNRLEQLERDFSKEKSVAVAEVQVMTLGGTELECEALKRTNELLRKQLQSVGRYNEELLAKYEPPPESSEEEEEDTEEADEVEEDATPSLPVRPQISSRHALKLSEGPLAAYVPVSEFSSRAEATATDVGDDHEEWLDAVASTPIPAEAATQVAGDVENEDATGTTALAPRAETEVEEEAPELTVVQGEDLVFEIVPRVCEDAND